MKTRYVNVLTIIGHYVIIYCLWYTIRSKAYRYDMMDGALISWKTIFVIIILSSFV